LRAHLGRRRDASRAGGEAMSFLRGIAAATFGVLAMSTLGCGIGALPKGTYATIVETKHRTVPAPQISQADWNVSRARLARMRKEQPTKPYVERIRIAIREPRTGRVFEARGAVAISPDRAARLMLLGPGGTTGLDMWVTKERFRFAVPALKLERRGGTDPVEMRGLPIGLLRWWFLRPLEGRLLLARSTPTETAWVFRDGPATITVRTDGLRFVAIRREGGHLEGIEWIGRALVPHAGVRGRYVEGDWGLLVDVIVEEVMPSEPDPGAFLDPDDKGTTL
jgi:hypothetical protein